MQAILHATKPQVKSSRTLARSILLIQAAMAPANANKTPTLHQHISSSTLDAGRALQLVRSS